MFRRCYRDEEVSAAEEKVTRAIEEVTTAETNYIEAMKKHSETDFLLQCYKTLHESAVSAAEKGLYAAQSTHAALAEQMQRLVGSGPSTLPGEPQSH